MPTLHQWIYQEPYAGLGISMAFASNASTMEAYDRLLALRHWAIGISNKESMSAKEFVAYEAARAVLGEQSKFLERMLKKHPNRKVRKYFTPIIN